MPKLKFGKAFPDQLNKVRDKTGHFKSHKFGGGSWQENLITGEMESENQTARLNEWRIIFFGIFILVLFAGLFIRIFHLQVVMGKDNRELADSNRIQIKVIHAPRGVIYDRNGKILAQNEPGFRLLEASPSGFTQHLTRDEALKMEVSGDPRLKDLEIDSIRSYPLGEKTSHVLGYVSEITAEELKNPNYQNYKLGDIIGRGGVEQSYEKVLKGVDGGEVVEVDAQGKKIRTLRTTDPIPGQKLYLTIDMNLQEVAYKSLLDAVKKSGSCCGAVIAQDPRNGEILAMASIPSYDPKNLSNALIAPNSPMLNRVIGGTYPPGSTFKIVSSLAGLSSGKITEKTQFEDTGIMSLGPFTFANWYFTEYGKKEEGGVDVIRALKRSNDIYFYQLGQLTGEKAIGDTAKKLGFGKPLGIEIPGEEPGIIPDNSWKVKHIGEGWYPGDTLHMAIGQGFVLTTPLQISGMISTMASYGKQFPPHLGLKITDQDGRAIKQYKYDPLMGETFKGEYLDLVLKGLAEVPKNGGTAWPFFNFPIETAGKTGTAEFGDPKDKTHAWYTAFAPLNNPKISATVLVEAGGEGSTVASPVVKEIFRYYFSEDKKNLIKDVVQVSTESARTLGE